MIRTCLVALAGAASLVAVAAEAATVQRYTSAYFFGDSLSDPGNIFALSGGTNPPSPPYFEGRRSNGPVWAEHVAAGFTGQGLAARNFALAFANAVPNDDVAEGLPFQIDDLPGQLASFGAIDPAERGARPVAMLWFGANDLIDAINPAATGDSVAATAVDAATAVADGIGALRDLGVKDVVVLNLPSLDKVPAFALGSPGAAALAGLGSDLFNATLDELIDGMKGKRRITRVDIAATFDDLIAHPENYGVANATIPCIIPNVSICAPGLADLLAFYDPVHPNRVIHGEIAGLVGAVAAPVPLPAPLGLLLAGFAGLAGLRAGARRRRP